MQLNLHKLSSHLKQPLLSTYFISEDKPWQYGKTLYLICATDHNSNNGQAPDKLTAQKADIIPFVAILN